MMTAEIVLKNSVLYAYPKNIQKYVKQLMFSIECQKFSEKKWLSHLVPHENSFPSMQRTYSLTMYLIRG